LTLKIFLSYGYFILKSSQRSVIWRWAVLRKKTRWRPNKICEIFCGKSLKEDLSINTTFDPCCFSWDSPFKARYDRSLKEHCNYWSFTTYIFFWKVPLAFGIIYLITLLSISSVFWVRKMKSIHLSVLFSYVQHYGLPNVKCLCTVCTHILNYSIFVKLPGYM